MGGISIAKDANGDCDILFRRSVVHKGNAEDRLDGAGDLGAKVDDKDGLVGAGGLGIDIIFLFE